MFAFYTIFLTTEKHGKGHNSENNMVGQIEERVKNTNKKITQGQEGNMYIYKIKYLHFYKGSMLSIDLN